MDEDTGSTALATPVEARSVPLAGTQSRELVPAPTPPVALPGSKPKAGRRRWPRVALALAIMAGLAGGGFYVWRQSQSQLPPGIAFGNGRNRGGRDRYRHQVRGAHRRDARRRRRHGQSVSGARPHGHQGSRSVASKVRIAGPTGPAEPRRG